MVEELKKIANPLAKNLGVKIAEIRKQREWTQASLAERVGVDTETISRFERGATIPSLMTLEKIAQCLKIGVAELFSESSTVPDDQAVMISAWLSDLNTSDRAFVLDLIKRTCEHLRA